jgi:mono/diheme cytochrome c family protein
MRLKRSLPLLALLAAALATARWWPDWYWGWRTDNPVRRGAGLAAHAGCLTCHLPAGRDEASNPGSRWGTVPSFYRGNLMMYVKSPGEVARFIADGTAGSAAPSSRGGYGSMPDSEPAPPFHMRGFKDRLSRRQIQDLAAFVLAADGYLVPLEGPVARGSQLCAKFACESCHGVGGSGGVPNPRSFTLHVPGWVGPDFPHLVSGKEEFRRWVLDGRSPRLAADRAASFFLDRANLYMPAFRGSLSDDEVDAIWAYVSWLRRHAGWKGGEPPRPEE